MKEVLVGFIIGWLAFSGAKTYFIDYKTKYELQARELDLREKELNCE